MSGHLPFGEARESLLLSYLTVCSGSTSDGRRSARSGRAFRTPRAALRHGAVESEPLYAFAETELLTLLYRSV